MRLLPTAALFAFACALFSTGFASAATIVTIDGAPVEGAIIHDGHILVPFRAPMQQIGATVVWTDADQTGVASASGQELVRTVIGQSIAIIDGYPKALTVAPVLIEPQHLEYVPVEILPEISNAVLTLAPDGNSATVTDFDLAGVHSVGTSASSNDPNGRVLLVWVWLLPISALLCGFAYFAAIREMNRRRAYPYTATVPPIGDINDPRRP